MPLFIPPGPPRCIGCGRTPEQIDEYTAFAREFEMTNTEFVMKEEGTYNPLTNHFACDTCYINMGMPAGGPGGRWVAP